MSVSIDDTANDGAVGEADKVMQAVDGVIGGSADDVLVGSNEATGDGLRGGPGNDMLWGGGGDDGIVGEDGSDEVHGGDGNDHFAAVPEDDRGADSLFGEGGDDVFGRLDDGSTDKVDGGAGTDSVGTKDDFDILIAIP